MCANRYGKFSCIRQLEIGLLVFDGPVAFELTIGLCIDQLPYNGVCVTST